MQIRVCGDLSCGCSSPDCYKVTDHGDVFIFVNEDTNEKYSLSRDMILLGLNNNSVAINKQKLNKSAHAKLKEFLGA